MDWRIAICEYSSAREAVTFTLERNPCVFLVSRETLNDMHGSTACGKDAVLAEFERASTHIVDKAVKLKPDEDGNLVLTYELMSPGYQA